MRERCHAGKQALESVEAFHSQLWGLVTTKRGQVARLPERDRDPSHPTLPLTSAATVREAAGLGMADQGRGRSRGRGRFNGDKQGGGNWNQEGNIQMQQQQMGPPPPPQFFGYGYQGQAPPPWGFAGQFNPQFSQQQPPWANMPPQWYGAPPPVGNQAIGQGNDNKSGGQSSESAATGKAASRGMAKKKVDQPGKNPSDSASLMSYAKVTCFNFGEPGHHMEGCDKQKACFICKAVNHKVEDCPVKKKPHSCAKFVGSAAQGLGFYNVDVPDINSQHAGGMKNVGLVFVESGNISKQELAQEFSEIYKTNWPWPNNSLDDWSFLVKFPPSNPSRTSCRLSLLWSQKGKCDSECSCVERKNRL